MRGQGRQTSAVTGERHDGRAPFGVHLSCTIEIVTRLCPDGDAPWRACSWVCVSGPAARASRRVAWSCEFSSSMGAVGCGALVRLVRGELAWDCYEIVRDRTRRACLGGGGGARLSSQWTLARGQARGGARFSTLTRDAVCCCVAVDGRRESVWRAPCVAGPGSALDNHGGSLLHYTASRHPCASRPLE
jgi:hypothetical protein